MSHICSDFKNTEGGGSLRLLIVDDNEKISEMMRKAFESEFSEISLCNDGIDALDEYERFKPEWVFMDIKMKKMDGLKAAKKILSNYPEAKIIIVTSYDSNALRKEAKNAGVVDFIVKDELDKIFKIINSHTTY
jgi:CheY-like chemotaxis protein